MLVWLVMTKTHFDCRDYAPAKIQENVQAEIMQVVLEEARESYSSDLVWVCRHSRGCNDSDTESAVGAAQQHDRGP